MRFQNLARYPDIGTNCYLLETGGTRIVLDAGTHPKHTGKDTLPLFEKLEPGSLDAILLSHPHLDHIGGLPVLMKQHPEAAVAMTEATRENGGALLHNSVNVMKAQREELDEPAYPLYSHRAVDEAERTWLTREVGETFSLGDRERVSCRFFRAGHVLGAVGIRLEHDNRTFFYTGDVHFEEQTLVRAASFPVEKFDAMAIETTRGDHQRDPEYSRAAEQRRLGEAINRTLDRGGAVLIPVFAFGKTQELLLMLRELIDADVIPPVPVHIGGLSTRMTQIADRFSHDPGRNHRGFKLLEEFPGLRVLARGHREPEFHPGAIYALSSGMMSEHTVSHRFARRILPSEAHSILFVGYADKDSLAGRILAAGKGGRVALSDNSPHESEIRCDVERFDFSGHAPREQIVDYTVSCDPKTVLLVHGDEPARAWFKAELERRLPKARVIIPAPGESVDL
ncbi:MAG: MBL fold metallo-hydrolase [Verrucomicrobiaceae bacterium]|nr:MBL fold metallo-hydrolase [Verrucomicrobiaceae bacterium]